MIDITDHYFTRLALRCREEAEKLHAFSARKQPNGEAA